MIFARKAGESLPLEEEEATIEVVEVELVEEEERVVEEAVVDTVLSAVKISGNSVTFVVQHPISKTGLVSSISCRIVRVVQRSPGKLH